LRTAKINNENADRMLPAKLCTAKLSIPKAPPKFLLGVGLIATQSARVLSHH